MVPAEWELKPADVDTARFPLEIAANGRFLTDRQNNPFLIVGDSPQGMMACLSTAEMETYLSNRASYGINSIQVHVLSGITFGGRADFSTYDSITPFTVEGDLSTPRESYFARLDTLISLAAAQDIVVWLTAAEYIDGLTMLKANGTDKCYAFGQYLGNRYKNASNIVWNYGNDLQTYDVPADNAPFLDVCDGIKNKDANHIHTVWLKFYLSGSRWSSDWDSRIDVDLGYTYYPTYDIILDERALSPSKPVYLGEANYEAESNIGYLTTPFVIRKQMWWAMLAGACGHFYCNIDIFRFLSGWASRLDSYPGLADVPHLTSLCEAYEWWTWSPDNSHAILTAGYGTYEDGTDGSIDDNDYVSACSTPSNMAFLAYIPTQRQVTIAMSQMGPESVRCRWYDPSSGAYTAIGTYSNTGNRNFTPPDTNDWVLVLDQG